MSSLSVLLLAVIPALVALAGLRILNEHERGIVFRLGRFHRIVGPGLFIIAPSIERMARVDLPNAFPEWRSLDDKELQRRLHEGALTGDFRA